MTEETEKLMWRMNPWWQDGSVPESLRGISRPAYLESIKKFFSTDLALVLTGVRRSGKTTILYQLISEMLKDTDSRKILYLQLDHPELFKATIGELVEIFRAIHGIASDEDIYLFFDEAHMSPDWALWVKTLYDSGHVRIVVSGSSSALLSAGSMTHLTGRHLTVTVYPLSFREFLEFRGVKVRKGDERIYNKHLEDYLRTGGFPRVVLEENPILRERILLEYFDDIIFRDVVSVYKVRDLSSLRSAALLLLHSIGQPLSINKMKNLLGISLSTAREYVSMLESSYLFFSVPFSSGKVNERVYNPKKYYAIDTGLVNALASRATAGSLAENAVAVSMKRGGGEFGYWKDVVEVDFITGSTAVEVKYKNISGIGGLEGLQKAMKNGRAGKGMVILRDREGKESINTGGSRIDLVNMYEFLLDERADA